MKQIRGLYGPDDVPWDVQEARDNAEELRYKINKLEIDEQSRLDAKIGLMAAKHDESRLYQDKNGGIYVGYERNGNVLVYARVDIERGLLRFIPLEAANHWLAPWASVESIDLWKFKKIAPIGCI